MVNADVSEFDDLGRFSTHHPRTFVWQTEWDYMPNVWALVASASAVSRTHMDASGYCTFLRIILGMKVWFIGCGEPQAKVGEGWNDNDYTWQAVVLRPGDDL